MMMKMMIMMMMMISLHGVTVTPRVIKQKFEFGFIRLPHTYSH
jgi:hypothetical protein